MITHELMRELLNDDLGQIRDIAEFVPNEIVYKALVVREFMKERGIEDPRAGIREFTAFERDRLQKLGMVPQRPPAAPSPRADPPSPAHPRRPCWIPSTPSPNSVPSSTRARWCQDAERVQRPSSGRLPPVPPRLSKLSPSCTRRCRPAGGGCCPRSSESALF